MNISKEEMQAQMSRRKEQISKRIDALKDEATFSDVKAQAVAWKDRLRAHAALLAGGATGIGVLAALLPGRGKKGDPGEVPHRALTEDYVDRLAEAVARRMQAGFDLSTALGDTLRERAPLLLRMPPARSSSSAWRGLVGLALAAAVGFGLDYASRAVLGKDLITLVRDLVGSDEAGDTMHYTDVHGTAGAEMPDPDAGDHHAGVHGTAGAAVPPAGGV